MKTIPVSIFFLILSAILANAQPGTLDLTFNSTGYVITDINNSEEDCKYIDEQADGKIVVSGSIDSDNSSDFCLFRYLSNGSLDDSFGNSGAAQYDISGIGEDDKAREFIILPDNKILVAGRAITMEGYYESILVQLNTDGSLDNSFGTNGVIRHSLPETDIYLSNVHVLDDGKYLLTGRINDYNNADLAMMKLKTDGTHDHTFGTSGWVFYDSFGDFDIADKSVVLDNGDIVTAGWAYNPSSSDDYLILVGFDSNGSLNPDFGSNGFVGIDIKGGYDQYHALKIYQNTHLLAGGFVTIADHSDIIVSKFDFNGDLDLSFGLNGHAILDYQENDDVCQEIAIQTDGKLLVGGTVEDPLSGENFAILRLDQDGTPDTEFNETGWFVKDISNDDDAQDIALQSDGKILITGTTNDNSPNQDLLTMRVNSEHSGTTGPELEKDKILVTPNPASDLINVIGLKETDHQVQLIDLSGSIVLTVPAENREILINMSELPSGMYFIKVNSGLYKFIKK